MNERRIEKRYMNSEVPYDLCSVFLIFPDGSEVVSKLDNISSVGMRLTLSSDELFNDKFPRKEWEVGVHFPLKGMKVLVEYIYSEKNSNGTVTIGVHFVSPYQRNIFSELLMGVAC